MGDPRTTDVVVIGAGQAGLAMSRCLTDRSIDHVVLERGETANAWRTERWDSLRLLTPNWMSRLPGWTYRGDDPDGYRTAGEVAQDLDAYRRSFDAPVRSGTSVLKVVHGSPWHLVETDDGTWRTRAVVVATGACGTPRRPSFADELPGSIQQLAPIEYRNPSGVADGRVLVVGASASGAQIADELARAGRDVTLAVGEHVRLPRSYRGMDVHWWMDAIGQLDERYDEVEEIERARRLPSLQLVGSPERRDLDLNTLGDAGVSIVGRFVGERAGRAQFSGSLANVCALADLKLRRQLDRFDEFAAESGLAPELGAVSRPAPIRVGPPVLETDLRSISAIVWATGFRPNVPWLDPSLLDRRGGIVHDGGVLPVPGMYVLGLPFMRRRKSSFIDGAGFDAIELADHLAAHLDHASSPR
ncbi:MAG: NAD(P)-binding domain-containing protein [Actinobacteria bacterium]|nr:NAD(P)-binding domain-containing protein [Actinomycetota bacterium]